MLNKIKSLFKNKTKNPNNINIIKTHLTLKELFEFTNKVVEMCFIQDEEDNDIDYSPIWKEPTILNCFAEYYTDYKATDDIEVNYLTYKDLNPWNAKIDQGQFTSMIIAIDEMIDYRKKKLLQSQTPLAELIAEITKIVKGLGDNFDMETIGELAKKLSGIGELDEKNLVNEVLQFQRREDVK